MTTNTNTGSAHALAPPNLVAAVGDEPAPVTVATVHLTIRAPYHDGIREVAAFSTPVRGLVISRDEETPAGWNVCHQASGLSVADCPDPETALHIAVKLGEIGDWTRHIRELRRDKALHRAWAKIIVDARLTERYRQHGHLTNERLRQIESGVVTW